MLRSEGESDLREGKGGKEVDEEEGKVVEWKGEGMLCCYNLP